MIETFIKALSEKCLQVNSQSARKTAINITSNTIYIRILTYYITLHLTKNFGVVQQSRQAKFNIYTPPTLAGLFFCLASAEGAGLLFCPAAIQPNTSVYSVFCAVNANYTAHAIKRRTGLCSGISGYLPYSTATDNRPIQAVIIPHTPRWSVSQRRSASSEYQIPAPRRTLYRTAQPPYYNKVYKGAAVCPCYRSMPDSATHRRPCQPGGAVQQQGARRAARNHWRLPPYLFSGFRPIANRGQQ